MNKRPLCFNHGCTVTSWLCGRSPGRGFHRYTSACSAGASWGTGAWKRWAGTWYRRGVGCCYWSRCGSRCPCRPQRCPDPRLFVQGHRQTAHGEETRGGMLYYIMCVNNSDALFFVRCNRISLYLEQLRQRERCEKQRKRYNNVYKNYIISVCCLQSRCSAHRLYHKVRGVCTHKPFILYGDRERGKILLFGLLNLMPALCL